MDGNELPLYEGNILLLIVSVVVGVHAETTAEPKSTTATMTMPTVFPTTLLLLSVIVLFISALCNTVFSCWFWMVSKKRIFFFSFLLLVGTNNEGRKGSNDAIVLMIHRRWLGPARRQFWVVARQMVMMWYNVAGLQIHSQ